MGLLGFELEIDKPEETVFFICFRQNVLSDIGCLSKEKISLMFLAVSAAVVFLALLAEEQSLVLSAT